MVGLLSQELFEKLGLIFLFAFILSKTKLFRNFILQEKTRSIEKLIFMVAFGFAGILMTYWGTPVSGGIANSRTIPVVAAGIFGGPWVGMGAGLIAGYHRMFLVTGGELTAVACGISTFIGGLIGGLAKPWIEKKSETWLYGFIVGLGVEVIQMGLILLIARPFTEALRLVQVIFLPMTILNAIGIALFLMTSQQIYDDHEKAGALKAQLALDIATETLPVLRKGLTLKSAQKAAEMIRVKTQVAAVAFTNKTEVLAHVGTGSDHHIAGNLIATDMTRKVLKTGVMEIAQNRESIDCFEAGCQLKSAIVVPLFVEDQIIGTLKLYKRIENGIMPSDIGLAKGLGTLFSSQIELSKIEYQKKMLRESELKRLQAQIHPHFLFNALNTIISLIRTDPEVARQLLHKLSFFLRSSFRHQEAFIHLSEEVRTLEAYLAIEAARFQSRLQVKIDVEEGLECKIPPLILQPLVENAVKHGLLPKKEGGTVVLSVYRMEGHVVFTVLDDGVGIPEEGFGDLLKKKTSGGIGLRNVNERLKSIYGEQLIITSELGKGTAISFQIPDRRVANDSSHVG